MAVDVEVAQTLYRAIDNSLNSTLADGAANVISVLGGVYGSFWMLDFVIKSVYRLFNGLESNVQDILLSVGKAAIIMSFAFSVSWYIQTVVPFVNDAPTEISKLLSNTNANQQNMVDSVVSQYLDSVSKLLSAMKFNPITNFSGTMKGILALVCLLIGGIPFILVCVGTMVTLKVATTVLLSVGLMFIAFLLFDVTKQYFWGWVSVVGGFMLTQILFSVVITLEMNFINTNIIVNGEIQTTLLDCFSILIYFGSFTYLAVEIPGYAASIMGAQPSGGVTGMKGILGKTLGTNAASKASRGIGNALKNRFGNKIS